MLSYHAQPLILLLFLASQSKAANLCSLCETIYDFPKRWDFQLESDPILTCRDLYFSVITLNPTGNDCIEQKSKYQSTCCDDEEKTPENFPTLSPSTENLIGTEPECLICGTLEFPGLPNAVFSARYVGTFSCGEFYDRGLNGWIPSFMCAPLQAYAESICGCGYFNPKCMADSKDCWENASPSVNPTHSLPTNLPSDSSMIPSLEPSEDIQSSLPSQSPTLVATHLPSSRPSSSPLIAPSSVPTELACSQKELEALHNVCDCDEKKPGKPWKHEQEYKKCVEKAVKKSDCNFENVLLFSGCIPFSTPNPSSEPSRLPSATTSPDSSLSPSSPTCTQESLESLANVCDCEGKKPGKPWKSEKEYLKCVKKATKKSDCDIEKVLSSAGCLPFSA